MQNSVWGPGAEGVSSALAGSRGEAPGKFWVFRTSHNFKTAKEDGIFQKSEYINRKNYTYKNREIDSVLKFLKRNRSVISIVMLIDIQKLQFLMKILKLRVLAAHLSIQ